MNHYGRHTTDPQGGLSAAGPVETSSGNQPCWPTWQEGLISQRKKLGSRSDGARGPAWLVGAVGWGPEGPEAPPEDALELQLPWPATLTREGPFPRLTPPPVTPALGEPSLQSQRELSGSKTGWFCMRQQQAKGTGENRYLWSSLGPHRSLESPKGLQAPRAPVERWPPCLSGPRPVAIAISLPVLSCQGRGHSLRFL